MLIDKNDTIADVPIVRVRDALRRIAGGHDHVHPQALAHYAKISAEHAQRVVDALVMQHRLLPGKADRDGDLFFVLTTTGYGLANASAGRRFKRATAQRALDELLQRAEALNADPRARYGVAEILLFGSFLDPAAAEVSDVDLAVGTFMIHQPTQQEAGDAYFRMMKGRRPGPEDPILRDDILPYLKGGKAVLSPVELEQHKALLETVPNKIIWIRNTGGMP